MACDDEDIFGECVFGDVGSMGNKGSVPPPVTSCWEVWDVRLMVEMEGLPLTTGMVDERRLNERAIKF